MECCVHIIFKAYFSGSGRAPKRAAKSDMSAQKRKRKIIDDDEDSPPPKVQAGSPNKASPPEDGDESSDDEIILLRKFGRRAQQKVEVKVESTASPVKSKVAPLTPGRKLS